MCWNMAQLLPEIATRASHCVSCNLSWRWGIAKVVWMFAFLITVFRRIKGTCPVTKALFLYMVGERERKESCKVDGMITTSFQFKVRALITGVWSPVQWPWLFKPHRATPSAESHPVPARLVVRPPPWMGEKSLIWSCLLRDVIPEPAAHVGDFPSLLEEVFLVLQGQGQFLMVEGDFMSSGRTGMQIQIGFCFFKKKNNTSSSAIFYPALMISMLWMYLFLFLFLL